MKVWPVKFEITDDAHMLLAVVDILDTSSATVDIKTVVSRSTWPELSGKIAECLSAMQLDGDAVTVGDIEPDPVAEADDWSDAPDWAEYRAMDASGVWYYYSGAPNQGGMVWVPGPHRGKRARRPASVPDGIDWRESLQRRPRRES